MMNAAPPMAASFIPDTAPSSLSSSSSSHNNNVPDTVTSGNSISNSSGNSISAGASQPLSASIVSSSSSTTAASASASSSTAIIPEVATSASTDSITNNSNNNSNSNNNNNTAKRSRAYSVSSARRRFAECALIEIIHLHDCLRGALFEIQTDVQTLVDSASFIGTSSSKTFQIHIAADLSNSVASRFHLIWSVFQAHSGAEDEFIWPALKMKIESKKSSAGNSNNNNNINNSNNNSASSSTTSSTKNTTADNSKKCGCESLLEQEEYEEDHAAEETMFKQIHTTLRRLNGSFRYYHANVTSTTSTSNDNDATASTTTSNDNDATTTTANTSSATSSTSSTTANDSTSATTANNTNSKKPTTIKTDEQSCLTIIKNVIYQLKEQTDNLTQHLTQHLEKEETQCLPMVQKHLSNDEISLLVGNIMGQRSADVMSKILNLAVWSLPGDEREDMVSHMKKAMVGTFFEKWLTMGGWADHNNGTNSNHYGTNSNNGSASANANANNGSANNPDASVSIRSSSLNQGNSGTTTNSTTNTNTTTNTVNNNNENNTNTNNTGTNVNSTTNNNSNNNNSNNNNNNTNNNSPANTNNNTNNNNNSNSTRTNISTSTSNITITRVDSARRSLDVMDEPPTKKLKRQRHHHDPRLRYPSRYYVKENDQIKLIWNSMEDNSKSTPSSRSIPQFTISELTPTYHFSEKKGGMVLGCEHYMRECKLRHPDTGELYTCRLCCEEIRQSFRYRDELLPQLDRFKVTEVLCMRCGSLQPAGDKCVNSDCFKSHGRKFASYSCSICHLYDDSGTSIYHCPYCNVCRKGKGLGIDFRHCMQCNACVSIGEKHKCISQRLQGNCPICHETMFESTEPLRGLKCGHVMHLSCFNEYISRATLGRLTCPLCKMSFENMRG